MNASESRGGCHMSWKRMLARSNAFDASERSIAASILSYSAEAAPLEGVKWKGPWCAAYVSSQLCPRVGIREARMTQVRCRSLSSTPNTCIQQHHHATRPVAAAIHPRASIHIGQNADIRRLFAAFDHLSHPSRLLAWPLFPAAMARPHVGGPQARGPAPLARTWRGA